MFVRGISRLAAHSAQRNHLPVRAYRCFSTIVVERDSISVPALHASFPFVWLRDSCQCPSCVHPSTRQKLHRSSDFARDVPPRPVSAEAVDGGLRIAWSSRPDSASTEHQSFYSADFLARHSSPSTLFTFHRDVSPEPWVASQFASRTAFPYTSLNHPETLLEVYKQLKSDGLVFFSGIPTEETSDEKCELRKLATRLSVLRRTFYGETWDVRNIRNSKNIAYTNLDLGLHMDLLYFKEPPRYQILHALRNRVHGGQSLFVDALHAANRLQSAFPKDFNILANTPVLFHYINDGHHLHHSHPTFEISQLSDKPNGAGKTTEMTSINYSPPFQAPLPVGTPRAFYKALAKFEDLLNDPAACVTRLLHEGDAVIFDNRRVLHGRAAFEEIDDGTGKEGGGEGETSRWLKGCYLEEDPVLDRMRVLSEEIEK
ncbi:Clavaminate synthase-like protein [Sanghuangporus baumii]|uniref:Clavaminate synthase-like protein n=1 Tax=Sanghuangporus baumii TaxID=108892 RepID=A0A9Q5N6X8_SANBA|nr:Clavaminate synthase-like protein [Sanghuangporus baumii]